ncbi:MAG: FAD-dependent oxidoreductase [Trueperaceae bacterium]
MTSSAGRPVPFGSDSGEAPTGDAHVIVVGAGVAGLTLTYELARRGIDVLVVEKGRVAAQGASSLPAALLNPHRGRTARASATDLAGLEAFWRLADQLEAEGFAAGARRSGVLRIPTSARQARDWQRLPGPTWLEPSDVPSPYHAPHGALLVPDGGWVEPAALLSALAASAVRRGARILEDTEVVALACDGGPAKVMLVDTRFERPDDERAERDEGASPVVRTEHTSVAEHVVLCVGAGAVAGVRLPRFEHAEGAAVVLEMATTPPYPLAGSVNAAFTAHRAVVNGGHVPTGTADPERLRAALARFVPAAADARVTTSWTGVRVRRSSGVPVARRLHPRVTLFGAMAGRGFLSGAWYAERIAARFDEAPMLRAGRH